VTFGAPLSSLSVNCTDDFLLASGSSCDVVVYDTQTGRPLQRGVGVHSHLINISRFTNSLPHIFATASLDQTCKIWDLRLPLLSDRPIKVLHTSGPNVMCSFSPNDRHLLCSGVGDHLVQFEVPSFQMVPKSFNLCGLGGSSAAVGRYGRARFRRSAYLASSQRFATAATGESVVRLLSCAGAELGAFDFRGVCLRPLLGRPSSAPTLAAAPAASPTHWLPAHPEVSVQSLKAHPVFGDRLGALLQFGGANLAGHVAEQPASSARSCVALLSLNP